MGKVFVCSKCSEVVESQFLKKGEIYIHKRCGGETDVPSESLDKSVVIRIQKEHEKWKLREEKKKWEKEQEKLKLKEEKKKELENRTLYDKYEILWIFKVILWIFLVLEIVGGIIVMINIQDAFDVLPVWTILIYCCVYIFGIFGIYCGIKIIDFLFDLDKTKSDKVN